MAVKLNNVSLSFNDKVVFDQLSLDIKAGEFVSILGQSSIGKSVLLKMILGEIKPTSGEVLVNNKPVIAPSKHVGMVWQDHMILPWLTLRNNIMLATNDKSQVEHMANLLHITEYLDYYPKSVSGGTKQRAAIARALATKTDILLLDEPLCSIDYITAAHIKEDLAVVTKGKTIIHVTHNIDDALEMSTRIICLKNKKVSFDTTQIETCSKSQLLSML